MITIDQHLGNGAAAGITAANPETVTAPTSGNPFWGRNQLEHRNRRRICLRWMLFAISRQHPALSWITLIRVTTWSRWTWLSAISSRLLHRNRSYRHRHGKKCATWTTRTSCRRTRGLPPARRKAGTRRLHYYTCHPERPPNSSQTPTWLYPSRRRGTGSRIGPGMQSTA